MKTIPLLRPTNAVSALSGSSETLNEPQPALQAGSDTLGSLSHSRGLDRLLGRRLGNHHCKGGQVSRQIAAYRTPASPHLVDWSLVASASLPPYLWSLVSALFRNAPVDFTNNQPQELVHRIVFGSPGHFLSLDAALGPCTFLGDSERSSSFSPCRLPIRQRSGTSDRPSGNLSLLACSWRSSARETAPWSYVPGTGISMSSAELPCTNPMAG